MSKESLAPSGYPEGSLAAAILCAGFGTRLKPITQHLPKPCLPLLGKPLAIHWADRLAQCGIRQLGANVHHLPEQMTQCLHEEAAWAQWSISHERDVILGTGGGVREIWRRIGREKTLLLCHGDVMVGSQLAELLALHRSSRAAATLLLVLRTPEQSLRGVFTDASGRVVQLLRARSAAQLPPLFEHAFTGVQVLEPEVFDMIPPEGPACLVTQVYADMLSKGMPIAAMLSSAFFADLGTPSRFLDAQKQVLDAPALQVALLGETLQSCAISAQAVIEDGAELLGPVSVGPGVRVRAGSRIGPHVVLTGQLDVHAQLSNVSAWGQGKLHADHHDTLLFVKGEQLIGAAA